MASISRMSSYNINIRVKERIKLKDFVETSDNPFNSGQSMIGLSNKKSKKENKFEKLRKEIEKEKDPEIKAELKKGNIVTIIEDSLDY